MEGITEPYRWWSRFWNQNARRTVGHVSKGEHVVVRIGRRGIAEFRSNPGQQSKISPRSSHPSPQKCCIHSDVFLHSGYQVARRKVGHFSKGKHVVERIGGREIAKFHSNRGQDSKISPRSGHPSPQKCCIHSEFFYFAIYASGLRRPGSALKDNRTLPLVDGKMKNIK